MKYAERNIEAQDFRCASCAYFKGRSIFEAPCADLGGKDNDMPCTRYTVNPKRWSAETRAKLLQAIHLIHDSGVPITDLKGLLYTAERLPAKHPFGSRAWISIGKGKDEMHILATAIGKTTNVRDKRKLATDDGKFTLMSETGALIVVSDAELVTDTDKSALDFNLPAFDIELTGKKKTEKIEKGKPAEAAGSKRQTLRGDDTPTPEIGKTKDKPTEKHERLGAHRKPAKKGTIIVKRR